MKTPLLALPLLVLASCARAQSVKLPPAPDSAQGKPAESLEDATPAPVNSEGVFTGKFEDLEVAKDCSPAKLYREKSKPERFYVGFGKNTEHLKLWFQNPPSKDGKYPKPPDPDKLFCTRKPGSPDSDKKKPFQIWNYPGHPDSQGLYAWAWEHKKRDSDGKTVPTKVRPIMWWGLSMGQELDELSDEALAKRLHGGPGVDSGLGFKDSPK